MDGNDMSSGGKCPVMHGGNTAMGSTVTGWWPNALNFDILHQHDVKSNPLGADFNYHDELKKLDVEALKARLREIAGEIETLSGAPVADSIAFRAANLLEANPSDTAHAAETLTIGLSAAH